MQRRKLFLLFVCLLPLAIAFPEPHMNFRAHDLYARDSDPEPIHQSPALGQSLDPRGLKKFWKGKFPAKILYPQCSRASTRKYCESFCKCVKNQLHCQLSPGDMQGLEQQQWIEEREGVCRQNCKCVKRPSRINNWQGGYSPGGYSEKGTPEKG